MLLRDVGNIKAGTIITPKILKQLDPNEEIYVRSPITCKASEGICARCAGAREKGKLPDIGDNVGMPSAQALGEKMAQGMLSAKHSGGMAGGPSIHGGFDYLNQLIQVPTNFAGSATIAKADGRVSGIEEAPQGGHYITIDKEKYYVAQDQLPTVKVGEEVEAGDIMSNGVGNPADITEHKGIGHGRLYFLKTLYDGFKNSGITPHRRNVEVLARSLVNHVQVTDPDGYNGFLPDDIVQYDELRRNWEPREGSYESEPKRAINKYLEKDTLQYSIGTRITPKIAQDLYKNRISKIHVHDNAPPFKPIMVRAMESAMYDPNWQTRMYGSFLGKGFREAVHRGRESPIHDTSFVPSMAEGVDFGKKLKTEGKY